MSACQVARRLVKYAHVEAVTRSGEFGKFGATEMLRVGAVPEGVAKRHVGKRSSPRVRRGYYVLNRPLEY